MGRSGGRRNRRKPGGGRFAALALIGVIVLALGGYLFLKPHQEAARQAPPQPSTARTSPVPPAVPPAVQGQPSSGIPAPSGNVPRPGDAQYPVAPPPPPAAGAQPEQASGRGELAVIIDDMGSSMQEARSLAGIGVPLTFSIIPGLARYREVASFAAASSGIETMIHIPMQPKGWPQRRLEANGLLLSMDDASVTERLEGFMRDIPNAVGANNHMGSEYTEHVEQMAVVLGALKARGLFFVDSVTSPRTTGLRLAREMGIRSGRRHVFLDNEQELAYIRGQLDQAVRQARKTGAGIAICHPHPATIKALALLLPGLERQGITLVPASRLVR